MEQAYHDELTKEEREAMRAELLGEHADNALNFQAEAIKRYGVAGGVMLRELLFWDGKGWDPNGWQYQTKREFEDKTGLSAKSQDGGRERLEQAGVLEVERRPRHNPDGRCIHPSKVLHYRLDLPELLEQMSEDSETLNRDFKHADSDARTRGSEPSSTPKGSFQHAVTGAPYTEVTPEATTEGTTEDSSLQEGENGFSSRPSPPTHDFNDDYFDGPSSKCQWFNSQKQSCTFSESRCECTKPM